MRATHEAPAVEDATDTITGMSDEFNSPQHDPDQEATALAAIAFAFRRIMARSKTKPSGEQLMAAWLQSNLRKGVVPFF